jgi:hypothetical protein
LRKRMNRITTGWVGKLEWAEWKNANKFDGDKANLPEVKRIKADQDYWQSEWPPVKVRITVEEV